MKESVRLNKFISDSGFCSRREADQYIEDKQVKVNGKMADVGTIISPNDKVVVNGKPIVIKTEKVYIAFNKPTGITCTTDLKDPTNIIDYIGYKERIFPIGRLDKDSEGLIFLTNDGDIVNRILRAGNNHEKEYIVTVDRKITESFIKKMSQGVQIHDQITLPCKVEHVKSNKFKITLVQGLNRQIRRMCKALGYEVVELKRVRIMNVDIKGIETGVWRYISEDELEKLLKLIEKSSKTKEASRIPKAKKAKSTSKTKSKKKKQKHGPKLVGRAYTGKTGKSSPIRSLNKKNKKKK